MLSFLDLIHPDGLGRRVAVLGDGCPPAFHLAQRALSVSGAAVDLVVIAPDAREAKSTTWLDQAVESTDRVLAADGVAYALVPRRARGHLVGLVERCHLKVEAAYAHLRQGTATQYTIPSTRTVARDVVGRLSAPASSVRLASWMLSVPGGATLVERGWPAVGFVIRRPAARAAFEWLGPAHRCHPTRVVVREKVRPDDVTAVVSSYGPATGGPMQILKIALTDGGARRLCREAAMLQQLGPLATSAGAAVAACERFPVRDGSDGLALSVLRGHPVDVLLARTPSRLPEIIDVTAAWLHRWNVMTQQPSDAAHLLERMLEPAFEVAELLPHGTAYLHWLEARCLAVKATPLPMVASHNDLTMSNLLLDTADGSIAVLDWEVARADGLPLTDLFYAAADAHAAAHGWKSRGASLIAAFDERCVFGRTIAAHARRLSEALGVDPEVVELLKHGCALQHAANEAQDRRRTSRPFLELLTWLCAGRQEAR